MNITANPWGGLSIRKECFYIIQYQKCNLSMCLYYDNTMQKSVFYLPLTPETNNTKMNKTDAKEEKWKKQTKQGCPTFMKIENNSWAAAHSASRFMTEMKEAVCTHHCWCLLLLISKEGSLQGIFTFYLYYYNYYYIIYNLSVLVLVLCLFCCFLSSGIFSDK